MLFPYDVCIIMYKLYGPFQNKYSLISKFDHGYKMHKMICNVLLSVYESLQTSFESLVAKLPKHVQISIGEYFTEHYDLII